MPLAAASSGLSATARMRLPVGVRCIRMNTRASAASAAPTMYRSVGRMRTPPKFQARVNGRSKVYWSWPAKNVIVLRKAKATPIEAIRRDTFERDSSGRNTRHRRTD